MKLTGLFVWSARVEVEVPNNATEEQRKDALYEASQQAELDFKHPVLHECSDPRLID